MTVTYTTSDANAFSCTGDDDADEGSHVVTRTFTVTATDCGNSTTESIDQTITITDDTAPTVSLDAPADETVYLDASCYAAPLATPVSGDASGFLVTATDNCDSDVAHTIAVSDDTTYTGVVDGVGSYEILRTYTVTVTDDCGNEASATTSHTISVLDEINPDVTADFPADLIIYADDDNGYFDPTPLSTGAASADYSDNCSGSGDQTYGVAGQVPTGGLIITAIGDPNDDWQTCRFVEIHNSGDSDIDLTGYALQRWTNGNAGPSTGSNIDLSSIGTMARVSTPGLPTTPASQTATASPRPSLRELADRLTATVTTRLPSLTAPPTSSTCSVWPARTDPTPVTSSRTALRCVPVPTRTRTAVLGMSPAGLCTATDPPPAVARTTTLVSRRTRATSPCWSTIGPVPVRRLRRRTSTAWTSATPTRRPAIRLRPATPSSGRGPLR